VLCICGVGGSHPPRSVDIATTRSGYSTITEHATISILLALLREHIFAPERCKPCQSCTGSSSASLPFCFRPPPGPSIPLAVFRNFSTRPGPRQMECRPIFGRSPRHATAICGWARSMAFIGLTESRSRESRRTCCRAPASMRLPRHHPAGFGSDMNDPSV